MWKPGDCPDSFWNRVVTYRETTLKALIHYGDINHTACFVILSRFQMFLLRYLTSGGSLYLSNPKGLTHKMDKAPLLQLQVQAKWKRDMYLALLKPATLHFLTHIPRLHEQAHENQQHWTLIYQVVAELRTYKKLPLFSTAQGTPSNFPLKLVKSTPIKFPRAESDYY